MMDWVTTGTLTDVRCAQDGYSALAVAKGSCAHLSPGACHRGWYGVANWRTGRDGDGGGGQAGWVGRVVMRQVRGAGRSLSENPGSHAPFIYCTEDPNPSITAQEAEFPMAFESLVNIQEQIMPDLCGCGGLCSSGALRGWLAPL